MESFDEEGPWYTKTPVGKNKLATFMTNICKQAGLSKTYSNHSIRATSITVLDTNDFSSRDIMSVSGHRSESSLKSYTGKVGTKRKQDMSRALSTALINEDETPAKVINCTTDCDGILDLTPEQINALFDDSFVVDTPVTNDNQENVKPNNNVSVDSITSSVSAVVQENQLAQCDARPDIFRNVSQCAGSQFIPYITRCVVNFNINYK